MDGFPGLYFVAGISKPHEHLLKVEGKEFEGPISAAEKQKERLFGSFGGKLFEKILDYPNPSDWAEGRSLEIPTWCVDKIEKDKNKVQESSTHLTTLLAEIIRMLIYLQLVSLIKS